MLLLGGKKEKKNVKKGEIERGGGVHALQATDLPRGGRKKNKKGVARDPNLF